jgi:hypothetical protein
MANRINVTLDDAIPGALERAHLCAGQARGGLGTQLDER